MTTPTPDQQALIQLAKILSNPVRIQMLEYLASSKYAMCTSFSRMISVPQPLASRHLKKMVECGINQKEKVGKTWIYSLNQELWKAVQDLRKMTSQP